MNITLRDWLEINQCMTVAREALADLDHKLALAVLAYPAAGGHAAEGELLRKMLADVESAAAALGKYDTHPRSEWPGGPSTGPDALPTLLNEPRAVPAHGGQAARHFTQAEIDAAVAAGLLRGHYGGPAGPAPRPPGKLPPSVTRAVRPASP